MHGETPQFDHTRSGETEPARGVRALEFYSGIGGLHLALARSSVRGEVVRAFDWDQTACQVYSANHGAGLVEKVDIGTLTPGALAAHNADLWLLSPSCQPYTVLSPAPKGAADPRAQSFLHLVRTVLPGLAAAHPHALPRRLLVENVAGFETSSTREVLLDTLRGLGYETIELLLTPLQFGVPNSRLRYYLLAKRAPLAFGAGFEEEEEGKVWRCIPGRGVPWVDPRMGARTEGVETPVDCVRAYLDAGDGCAEGHGGHAHAVPDKVLGKWGRLFDIVLPSARRTCCFTRGYTQLVERAGSILQENEELDTTATFDAFLQAQKTGAPDALAVLRPLRLRYFSPSELLRLFCFDAEAFRWPGGVSTKSKYRLIGNSVNVRVVSALIEYLYAP
ncbi:S-adenosyl-L-methionine-dependent methyltransferase [Dentipellis sp. KUC8613]|nr:S-adenosyl-L-methionine-dependent methyltransferase [Dentipellis sp. KUC8613]